MADDNFFQDDLQGVADLSQIEYVANVIFTKAGFSFAPYTVGGVFPFFRPRWVSSFERAEGWDYEEALLLGWNLVGPGSVLIDQEKGEALWHQFQSWSREAQGGQLQKMTANTGEIFYNFRPDRSKKEKVVHLITAAPKIQLVERRIERSQDIAYASR